MSYTVFARKYRPQTFEDLLNLVTSEARAKEDERKLRGHHSEILSARFSPDGTQIVFSGGQDGGLNIYTYDLRAQQATKRTQTGSHRKPIYSCDGLRILCCKDSIVQSMNIDGTAIEALTTEEEGPITDHTWLGTP